MDNFPYTARVNTAQTQNADVNQQRWVWLYRHIGSFNKDWATGYITGGVEYRFKTQEQHALFTLTWL